MYSKLGILLFSLLLLLTSPLNIVAKDNATAPKNKNTIEAKKVLLEAGASVFKQIFEAMSEKEKAGLKENAEEMNVPVEKLPAFVASMMVDKLYPSLFTFTPPEANRILKKDFQAKELKKSLKLSVDFLGDKNIELPRMLIAMLKSCQKGDFDDNVLQILFVEKCYAGQVKLVEEEMKQGAR